MRTTPRGEAPEGGTAAAGRWAILGVLGATASVLGFAVIASVTSAWHKTAATEQRLLPGTAVAGVDVGGQGVAAAETAAHAAGRAALTRQIAVTAGEGLVRRVSPEDLEATHDAERVVTAAREATLSASPLDLARIRWLGGTASFDAEVVARVSEDAVAELAAELAELVDRGPRDATIAWSGDGLELVEARPGRVVDQPAAAEAVRAALVGAADAVRLPMAVAEPAVATAAVEQVWPTVAEAVDAALDRPVTVVYGDTEWQVRPREVGAVPDPGTLVDLALAQAGTAQPAASDLRDAGVAALTVPEDAVAAFVDRVAEDVDRRPRDAAVDYSSGWVELQAERPGRAVDRAAAGQQLRAALGGAHDVVDLPVDAVAPQVTVDDYEHVLLVRQDQRRLYLYTDGDITHEWPVAIGASGSATPTGEFTVGAKRHSPTWYNPAPNGWGAGMPRVIGPGPGNPLGLRALNWDRDGYDTLIRFHGTAETFSIGRAASRGCVRLTNADVIELYDLVPSGATIVSTWG